MNPTGEQEPRATNDNTSWWLDYRTSVDRRRDRAVQVERLWSWGRLLGFAAMVLPMGLDGLGPSVTLSLSVAAMVGFGWAVVRHRAAKARRTFLDQLATVCAESQSRNGGRIVLVRSFSAPQAADPLQRVDPFFDDGSVWELTAQEIGDFDVHTPPVGLFGLLNRTSSVMGARRLCDYVHRIRVSVDRIETRQRCVRYLADRPPCRLRLMAGLAFARKWDTSFDRLVGAVRSVRPALAPSVAMGLRVWSGISFLATCEMIYLVSLGQYLWGYAFAGLFFFNASIYSGLKRRLDHALTPWRGTSAALGAYAQAAEIGCRELSRETPLEELRTALSLVADVRVVPALAGRVGWAESAGLFHILFNLLFFFDLHVACTILNRVLSYRDALLRGLSAMGELDALCSLASFSSEQPRRCFPELSAEPGLRIEGGCHPLIEPGVAVANDVTLTPTERIYVVTGSNMSGKSTLLRMVGVNVLLAQIGCAVCARRMTLSPLRIMTDLEAHDSLAGGESYFLAEVRHLRRMVLPPAGSAPILGLVDEPLRGTNSREQSAASVAVLEHLRDAGHFFLVATHDHHLNEVADGPAVRACHFREELGGGGMVFDYTLYEGPARSRNALRVLQREGFPESIVDRAHAWYRADDASGDGA
ncbi:MAG: hypothetical protein ACE5E5_08125 [Phycisphaerae bacterium]